MTAADLLIDSLARGLYDAHLEWREKLTGKDRYIMDPWGALLSQDKQPYLNAARELIAKEIRE